MGTSEQWWFWRVPAFLAVLPVVAFVVFFGGIWLFSADEYKAPPIHVVPVPAGFVSLAEGSESGSGGVVSRWVVLHDDSDRRFPDSVELLLSEMGHLGWEAADPPSGTDGCSRRGDLGFVMRGDECATVESGENLTVWRQDWLRLDWFGVPLSELIVVEVAYTDWGLGRRSMFP